MLLKYYTYLETIRRSLVVLHVDLCSYLTRCIYICIIHDKTMATLGLLMRRNKWIPDKYIKPVNHPRKKQYYCV